MFKIHFKESMPETSFNNRPKAIVVVEMLRTSFGLEPLCVIAGKKEEANCMEKVEYVLKTWVVYSLFIGTGIFVIGLINFIFEKGSTDLLLIVMGAFVGFLSSLCYTGTIPLKVLLPLFFLGIFFIITNKDSRLGYPAWIVGTLLLGTIITIISEKMLPNDSKFKKMVNVIVQDDTTSIAKD